MSRQTISTIILIILLGATAYVWYQNSPGVAEEDLRQEGEKTLDLSDVRRLKTLKFDTSILKDPFFNSLQFVNEITTLSAPETATGRQNPFLSF